LEIFSLVRLDGLQELSTLEEGAMPLLKVFTLMQCEALEKLSESYLGLKTLQKIRVYGCSMVLENLRMKETNTNVEVVTMSTEDTMTTTTHYHRLGVYDHSYDEFWCNELTVFLDKMSSRI
jgi:hypothetical protein